MPDYEDSLGDQNTFDGSSKPADRGPQSLGDEATLGGVGSDLESGSIEIDLEITDLASRYTIEGDLGKGGMGQVQLALDTRLDRKVAIKRIHGKALRNAKAWQRFETGAKTLAKLNHPNIVQVHEYGRSVDGPFMILEYVSGGNLLERCQEGPLSVDEAVNIACQLCDGISKCHASGVVHRDIKPANVLLSEEGIPKLNDFDLAKEQVEDSGMTMAGAVLGTLDFMPPEQRRDASLVDERSDVWSLAATLYQMLTGEPPRVIDLDDVPDSLRPALAKALKIKSESRYQTAQDFKNALQDSLAGKVETASQPIPQTGVELGAGKCPECHARNEANRKFCCECAASLRVACLKCETEIPIWDKVCGECGGKQAELLEQKLEFFTPKFIRIEELISYCEFEEAQEIINSITSIDDSRAQAVIDRANKLKGTLEFTRKQEFKNASDRLSEARSHLVAYDYGSAIRVLDGVPEIIRKRVTAELTTAGEKSLEDFYIELVRNKGDLDSLTQTIKQRVKGRDLDGLPSVVNRALELNPNQDNLRKLQVQLAERLAKRDEKYDEIYQKAHSYFSEGNSKAAWRLVSQVNEKGLPLKLKILKDKLAECLKLENDVASLVKDAKADGKIDLADIQLILPKTSEYLKRNPNHVVIKKLNDDLLVLIEKEIAITLAEGRSDDLMFVVAKFQEFKELINNYSTVPKTEKLNKKLGEYLRCFPVRYLKGIPHELYLNKEFAEHLRTSPESELKGMEIGLALIVFENELANKTGNDRLNFIVQLKKRFA